ncbi:WXG100 family type VII secretion target [Nocardia takedensis]|uniref:WXG100 family type VII secretion target n=1 Tax=Nocardia takedensis TaxID=259390 RepID=UPI003F76343B
MTVENTVYRVDLAHLDEVTDRVASLHRFVVDSLAEVDRRVAELDAQGRWSGAAREAHAAAHAQWSTAAAVMTEALAKMREAASTASSAYTATAAANARILGR